MSIKGSSIDLGGLFSAISGNTPTKNPLYGAKVDDDGNILIPDGQGGFQPASDNVMSDYQKQLDSGGFDKTSFSKPYQDPSWGQRTFNPQLANSISQANMAGTQQQVQANTAEAVRKSIATNIMKSNPALAQTGLNPEQEYSMFGNAPFQEPTNVNTQAQALATGETGAPSLLGKTYGEMAKREAEFKQGQQPTLQETEAESNKLGLMNTKGAVGRASTVNAAQDILAKLGLGQAEGEKGRMSTVENTKDIEANTRNLEAGTGNTIAQGANKLRDILAGTQSNNILRQLVESTYGPVAVSPFAVTNAVGKAGDVVSSVIHNPNFVNMLSQMQGKMGQGTGGVVAHDASGNPLPTPPISVSSVPIPGVVRPASATPNIPTGPASGKPTLEVPKDYPAGSPTRAEQIKGMIPLEGHPNLQIDSQGHLYNEKGERLKNYEGYLKDIIQDTLKNVNKKKESETLNENFQKEMNRPSIYPSHMMMPQ